APEPGTNPAPARAFCVGVSQSFTAPQLVVYLYAPQFMIFYNIAGSVSRAFYRNVKNHKIFLRSGE
ncbi:MAG: hypothetical protein LIO57_02950, partial [Oscillospiraceae bacterium]|nr:hypothetical protein [Oscillospiraceae bacterium]